VQLDEITYDTAGGVAGITLDRPEQLNPISARPGGTRDQILWALDAAEADPDVGCVVLSGAGRAFSAGGDLTGNARRETAYEHEAFLAGAESFHRRLREARLALVASCDLVVAAESARFGVPEGRIGLIGAAPLVSLVGRQWAKFLVLSGEQIDAACARDIGLVLTVEPDAEMLDRARDLARRLARMPSEATLLNKRTVDAIAEASGDAAGRLAGAARDVITLANSNRATAPDGRTFRTILDTEGMEGMKRARAAQYDTPWLR
jgi:enoyl-CoA hydratase/carnithine racemase